MAKKNAYEIDRQDIQMEWNYSTLLASDDTSRRFIGLHDRDLEVMNLEPPKASPELELHDQYEIATGSSWLEPHDILENKNAVCRWAKSRHLHLSRYLFAADRGCSNSDLLNQECIKQVQKRRYPVRL